MTDSSLDTISDAFQKTVHLDAHDVLYLGFWSSNMLENSKYIQKLFIILIKFYIHNMWTNRTNHMHCAKLTSRLYLINDNSSLLT